MRLGIDYRRLRRLAEGTTGIGGVVDTYILPNIGLYFRTSEGRLHEERMPEIYVLRHVPSDAAAEERIRRLPSLLGRDFVNRYKLITDRENNLVFLTDERVMIRRR